MSKQVYRQVLELERLALQDEIRRVKSCSDHASIAKYIRFIQQLHALEHRRDVIDKRLHALDHEPDGFWGDLRLNFRWMVDEFADGFERWAEEVTGRRSSTHEQQVHHH